MQFVQFTESRESGARPSSLAPPPLTPHNQLLHNKSVAVVAALSDRAGVNVLSSTRLYLKTCTTEFYIDMLFIFDTADIYYDTDIM